MISSSSGLSDFSGFVPFKATQDKWDHSTRREMQYLRTRLLALLRQHNLKQVRRRESINRLTYVLRWD